MNDYQTYEGTNPRGKTPADRRRTDRFPIRRDLQYRVLSKRGGDQAGDGMTINMSSSGLLFTVKNILLPGRSVEVSISWPVLLNGTCGLKLVARGRVVRYEEGLAAVEIHQYEFRTQTSADASGLRPS